MNAPKVGEVYERDGKQREVRRVVKIGSGFNVFWARPGTPDRNKDTWCATWNKWASGAELVKTPDRKD